MKYSDFNDALKDINRRLEKINQLDLEEKMFNLSIKCAYASNSFEKLQKFPSENGLFAWQAERLYFLYLANDYNPPIYAYSLKSEKGKKYFLSICNDIYNIDSLVFSDKYKKGSQISLLVEQQDDYQWFSMYMIYYYCFIIDSELVSKEYEKEFDIPFNMIAETMMAIYAIINTEGTVKGLNWANFLFEDIKDAFDKVTISLEEYKKRQKSYYDAWDGDFLNCNIVFEKTPLIENVPNNPITYRHALKALFTDIADPIKEKHSLEFGRLTEQFFANLFNDYKYLIVDIDRNPKIKNYELFDIGFEYDSHYVAIDVKSKIINPKVYFESMSMENENKIKGLLIQRLNAIKMINNSTADFAISKYDINNIYSLIVVNDCVNMSRSQINDLIDLTPEIEDEWKGYCKSHIFLVDYSCFLDLIIRDNNIVEILKSCENNTNNVLPKTISKRVNKIYDEWYKDISEKSFQRMKAKLV